MRVFRTILKLVFIITIIFNIWHLSLIRLWSPPTLTESLHLSKKIAHAFQPFDPSLKAAVVRNDSEFVYTILYDPLLLHLSYVPLFDNVAYRYSRILYAWLVVLLSAGRPRLFPYMMFLVSQSSYLLGALFVWKLSVQRGWTRWVVLGYLTLSGLVFSVFWNMTEPLALCLVIMGIYSWGIPRRGWAIFLFALSVLARETSFLIPFALYTQEWGEKQISLPKAIKELGFIILPFLLWKLYILIQLPAVWIYSYYPPQWGPSAPSVGRVTFPFAAMWVEGKFAWSHLTTHLEWKRNMSILFMTVPLIGFSVITFFRQRKSMWSFLAVSQAAFLTIISGNLWNYYMGAMRMVVPFYLFLLFWCADELA